MNTPNPLLPQGSLEAQQHQKRSATKIVVSSILALHGIVLGGLLFLGCKPEPTTQLADTSGIDPLAASPTPGAPGPDSSTPFGDLNLPTNDIVIPPVDTNFHSPFGADGSQGGTPPTNAPSPFGGQPGSPFVPGTSSNGDSTTVTKESEPAPATVKYTVVPKDTFTTIAKKHKVTLKSLTAANPNVDSRKLKVGQVLELPANVTPQTPPIPDGGPDSAAKSEASYTVKSGDTLTKIARDYKVTIKQLQQANGIKGSNIKVGQKLILPVASASNQ